MGRHKKRNQMKQQVVYRDEDSWKAICEDLTEAIHDGGKVLTAVAEETSNVVKAGGSGIIDWFTKQF